MLAYDTITTLQWIVGGLCFVVGTALLVLLLRLQELHWSDVRQALGLIVRRWR